MLDQLPRPDPDVSRLVTACRRGRPDRVPLIELAIAEEVLAALSDTPLAPLPRRGDRGHYRRFAADRLKMWHRLGYDYFRVRAEIPFLTRRLTARDTAALAAGEREWVDEHGGAIGSWDDLERYPWPTPSQIGFHLADAVSAELPGGMGMIGFSGGVLEWASTLMGLERFMLGLRRSPDLVREVVDRVGHVILEAFTVFCQMDDVVALWLGDDMGFKTATLISPAHLRELILPWHRRYAELAHAGGRLFLLHSCGHIEAIMPDLIEDVGIDAKHSFEDEVVPVETFKQRWGERVGVLGGLDVDMLSRGSVEQVRDRTMTVLEACTPGGGYACGSGNSVTNYVSPANYLAMVETVHRFNGRL